MVKCAYTLLLLLYIGSMSQYNWYYCRLHGYNAAIVIGDLLLLFTFYSGCSHECVSILSMKLLKLPLKPTDSVEVNVENGEKEKLLSEGWNEE